MKLLRFAVVGGTVTLVFMGLSKVFTDLWGKQIGFLAAYPIALTLHFFLNKWWTFGNHRRDRARQASEYLAMAAFTFAMQWLVYTLLVTWTAIAPAIAVLISNAAQMAVTYIIMDRRVFSSSVDTR